MQKDKTAQLIDLRTPVEVKQTGVIPGAKVINFNAPDFSTQVGRLDKKKPVIVYCAAGGRSPRAAQQMKQAGFKTIYDYTGGMNDWQSKGKKTVR
ncbi:MAG TPA: rhodanese-like domain-containing protein, partial [Saprospiraceae bacterium]|nr:rhodanese-like domain-containing protein [Saprospiraceae bacterium]